MSYVLPERLNRQEDIKKGLQFIQSSLPYFGSQKEYAIFVQKLIRNLFNEGNDLHKEGQKNDSINQYSEALSISNYAATEEIAVTSETLERLRVNRAACYLDMGLHEEALRDCEDALCINSKNLRALYCKSKALFVLERYKEAYEAIARCSLIAPKDESVVKLTQELAMKLGLKIRKAYVRPQPGNQVTVMDATEKTSDCLADQIEPDLPEIDDYNTPHSSFSALSVTSEALGEPSPIPVSSVSPSVRPISDIGLFPSALTSSDESVLFPNLNDEMIGDELDRILDSVPTSDDLNKTSNAIGGTSRMNAFAALETLPAYPSYSFSQLGMPSLDSFSLRPLSLTGSQREVSIFDHMNGTPNTGLGDTPLFSMTDTAYFLRSESPIDVSGICNKSPFVDCTVNGAASPVSSVSPLKSTNPLEDTHEFKQACQLCFTKVGSKLQSDSYLPNMDHKCKKDILVGRIKNSSDERWKKIRPRPTKNQYAGQYYICKDVAQGTECTYPGYCTFAYCQEEIDVWTLERKGTFCREILFGGNGKVSFTIPHLLQEYCGMFVFLCEKCFDHKPRIISLQNKDNPSTCSHPVSKHGFEENKCLVHMFRDTVVKYCKIRPFNIHFVLDLCRHEVRYGCLREDECFYAHSLVELRVWVIQKETGICFEEIVQDSQKYWAKESAALNPQA